MSSTSAYIVLAYITLLGRQSLMDAISVSNTRQGQGPITLPMNYTYTHDIGAHKIHTNWAVWAKARRICQQEGGYLAIINSAAEAAAVSQLLQQAGLWEGFVGIHDMFNEGEWITIHNEPLEQTGFDEWDDLEPNDVEHNENCGAFRTNKKFNDFPCSQGLQFICELFIEPTSTFRHDSS